MDEIQKQEWLWLFIQLPMIWIFAVTAAIFITGIVSMILHVKSYGFGSPRKRPDAPPRPTDRSIVCAKDDYDPNPFDDDAYLDTWLLEYLLRGYRTADGRADNEMETMLREREVHLKIKMREKGIPW